MIRPDSPFLSLPPSLSSLSMSDLSWTFCFPLYPASGVNTLFRDCIMIYVAFSEARVVLQRESEVTPVILLNRRVDHFVHFEFPLGQPFCSSSSGRSPSPPTTLLISLATCSTPAITLWIMAGLLTENMGLLLWLQGPNQSVRALIVVAPNQLQRQPGQLSPACISCFMELDFIGIFNYS